MTKSAQPHLELIQESLAQIDRYRPSSKAAFLAQPMVQDAVLMRLHVMGGSLASIRRLDVDAFDKVAHHSWHKLIGLRNIISHGYEIIDFDEIWQIITEELSRFSESIASASETLPYPLRQGRPLAAAGIDYWSSTHSGPGRRFLLQALLDPDPDQRRRANALRPRSPRQFGPIRPIQSNGQPLRQLTADGDFNWLELVRKIRRVVGIPELGLFFDVPERGNATLGRGGVSRSAGGLSWVMIPDPPFSRR